MFFPCNCSVGRANDAYSHLLGARSSQSKRDAERSFEQARRSYNEAREYYQDLADEVSISEGERLDELVGKSLEDMDQALNNTRVMLDKSVTSSQLPRESLDGFKKSIDSQISYIEQARQNLQTQRQAVTNAELSAESSEESLRLDLQKAKQNLENARQEAQSNLEAARSSVEAQKKALEQAEASYEQVTADPREVDLAPMRNSIEELRAARKNIQNKIEKAFIRAPFSGEVGSLPVDRGELVNPGDVVVSLVNKSGLQVRSYISPKDKKYVQAGASALITEEDIPGTVSHVSPQVDSERRKVEVITKVDTEDTDLVTGEYAEVRIDISSQVEEEGDYLLPFKAVKVEPDTAYVYVVDEDNRVQKKQVELGRVVNEYNRITGGLSPDMRIVENVRGLEEGQKVKIE